MTDPQWPPPAPYAPAPYAPGPYAPKPVSSGPPGTVWAAAIITYVISGLSILMTFVMLAFVAFIGGIFADAFTTEDKVGLSVIVVAVAGVFFVASIAACYLAHQTTRRKQWARIALAAWSGTIGLLGVLSLSPPGFLWTAGAIAVVVLLFVPDSNTWFDREGQEA